MNIQIDTLAYTNRLRFLAPQQKLLLASVLLIIAAFAHPPTQILITIWMSIWIVIYAGIPAKIYLRLIYIASLFWLTSLPALVINGVEFTHRLMLENDAILGLKIGAYFLYISKHGVEQSLGILSRAIASLSCLYFIMLTIPFTELLQIFRNLGFPALLTDLLLLIYRFIFILLNTANELWTAQNSRNGYRDFKISLNSLSLLIGQLFKRTLINYQQISLTLASRGFNGEFQVWHSQRYNLSKRYTIEAIFGCTILIILELHFLHFDHLRLI
ncbi:MAG TPA: cobalt ECF transporter T component CbiQ [Nostocaceae cyanobacterium]|nr:cobalt ECF transporter T component CbiQ [Nostocaceae cyanobacterium]